MIPVASRDGIWMVPRGQCSRRRAEGILLSGDGGGTVRCHRAGIDTRRNTALRATCLLCILHPARPPRKRQQEPRFCSWFIGNACRPDFSALSRKIEQVSTRSVEHEKEASPRWRQGAAVGRSHLRSPGHERSEGRIYCSPALAFWGCPWPSCLKTCRFTRRPSIWQATSRP